MGSKAKRVVATGLAVLLGAIGLTACGGDDSSGGPTEVSWYVFNEPGGGYDAAVARCNKQNKNRFKIDYVRLPTDADQQRELIVRRLAAKDSDIDLIGMDVIWTAEFAQADWIVPWDGANKEAAEKDVIPAILEAAKYEGKTWAAPFTTNTQLLWYHKDVVKGPPPKTWDELIASAKKIGPEKGKIVVQGRRYEGLVVWFNSLVASAGGEIIDRDEQIKLGEQAVTAATIIKRVATEAGTSTIGNDKEDTGNNAFDAEGLAYMVNYPFVYASAKEAGTEKNLGWARYPSVEPGKPSRVTFGGINLGVSKYSENREEAFAAAKCLKQDANLKEIAELGGLAPTREYLFDTPEIKKAFPFADVMQETLADGVPRPVLPAYSDVSLAIQSSLHPPADIEPEEAIKKMGENLEKAREGKLF